MAAKEENLPLLEWIQKETKHINPAGEDLERSHYMFRVEEIFQIHIEIDNALEKLSEYEVLSIEISQVHKEQPSSSNIKVQGVEMFINWYVMPSAVHPQKDERFSTQNWKEHFTEHNGHIGTKSVAQVSPDIACDIVRFCYTLTNLKAFW